MKPGDVILVRDGTSFISRGITLFMKVYKRKRNITLAKTYSHAGTIIDLWGTNYIAEANAKGYQIQKVTEAYSEKDWLNRIDIITPIVPYSEQEWKDISKYAVEYSIKINRYDFLNFIFQLWLIYTGKWIGPRGKKAENRFYCSEVVANLANKIRSGTFESPESTNPVDVAINPTYKFIC